jgi:hypothetical protein
MKHFIQFSRNFSRTYHMIIVAQVLLLSCASAPTTPAPWAASPAAIREVFPDSEYIAQRGRGKTREAAEANAAAEIARFLTSQINTTSGYTMTSSEVNGNVSETLETINEAYIQTQINLFGIRYVDDAFYDTAQKEWHSAAYIDRAEAWRIYEPQFKRQADSFQNLFDAAENEKEPFKQVLRYMAAQQYTRTVEFENANTFGQLLYPAKMDSEFSRIRTELASLPPKIDNGKRNATIFIDCPLDFESLVYNAFAEQFATLGFPVSRIRSATAAVCAITVNEGEQKRDTGIFYYPSLQAVLSGSSGALWTFNAQAERAAAVTPDVAKRRAYTGLAERINAEFSAQFNANSFN